MMLVENGFNGCEYFSIDKKESVHKQTEIYSIFSEMNDAFNSCKPNNVIDCYEKLRNYLNNNETHDFFGSIPTEKDSLVTKVFQRYNQLYDISYEDCGLEKMDKLLIADFIESQIHKTPLTKSTYFKKSCPLPRSLFYDVSQKATYILTKNHGGKPFCVKGSSKKVTLASQISDDRSRSSTLVAQAVNITSSVKDKGAVKIKKIRERDLANYKNMQSEVAFQKQLEGEGVYPILTVFEYSKPSKDGYKNPKIMVLMPKASSDLSAVFLEELDLSIDDLIDMMGQLASGIHRLHQNKYIHGDLKLGNVLLFVQEKKVVGGLNDFGSYLTVDGKKLREPFSEGYYGSAPATAPELFGDKAFKKDLFKAEIWAFGLLGYLALLKEDAGWEEILYKQAEYLEEPVDKKSIEAMHDLVTTTIEKPRQILVEKEERSLKEDYLLLIYDMMRLEPALRPDSGEVIERIAKLKEKSLSLQLDALAV